MADDGKPGRTPGAWLASLPGPGDGARMVSNSLPGPGDGARVVANASAEQPVATFQSFPGNSFGAPAPASVPPGAWLASQPGPGHGARMVANANAEQPVAFQSFQGNSLRAPAPANVPPPAAPPPAEIHPYEPRPRCASACADCARMRVRCEMLDSGACVKCVNAGRPCIPLVPRKRGPVPATQKRWRDDTRNAPETPRLVNSAAPDPRGAASAPRMHIALPLSMYQTLPHATTPRTPQPALSVSYATPVHPLGAPRGPLSARCANADTSLLPPQLPATPRPATVPPGAAGRFPVAAPCSVYYPHGANQLFDQLLHRPPPPIYALAPPQHADHARPQPPFPALPPQGSMFSFLDPRHQALPPPMPDPPAHGNGHVHGSTALTHAAAALQPQLEPPDAPAAHYFGT